MKKSTSKDGAGAGQAGAGSSASSSSTSTSASRAPVRPSSRNTRGPTGYRGFVEGLLLLGVFMTHMMLTPFTKVEESFNVHACYDLLFKPWLSVEQFDHISFPGVVPRTFLGPLFLTVFVRPFLSLFNFSSSHLPVLLLVRSVLSLFLCFSFVRVRSSVARVFRSGISGTMFMLFTAVQFHLPFYSSRLLPNTFALALTNLALSFWLPAILTMDTASVAASSAYSVLSVLSFTVAVFRSELVLLLFPIFIILILEQRVNPVKAVATCVGFALFGATLSVLIDSHFWMQWPTYPELKVFTYNALQGKSSAWGTSPFGWYWAYALPRTLGGSYVLALIAMSQANPRRVIVPAIFFITAYSFLPHKEVRFVFYALPFFNVCSAALVAAALDGSAKRKREAGGWMKIIKFASMKDLKKMAGGIIIIVIAITTLVASAAQTVVSLRASAWNYPSGYALQWLVMNETETKRILSNEQCKETHVHIDIDSAMQGISQFVYVDDRDDDIKDNEDEGCVRWRYSKDESVVDDDDALKQSFDYLITKRSTVEGFEVVHTEEGYDALDISKMKIGIKTKAATYVQRRVSPSASSSKEQAA